MKRWNQPPGQLASVQRLMKVISHLCMYDAGEAGSTQSAAVEAKVPIEGAGGGQ